MSIVLAIDPGTAESGWALYGKGKVLDSGVRPNDSMLAVVSACDAWCKSFGFPSPDLLAVEMIASYGMAVGREVFETCVLIGRLQQAWHRPDDVRLVYRRDVKLHLCGTVKATDSNIRAALIDLLGQQGKKSAPGPTYGVKSHAWPALAVAVTAARETKAMPTREELMGAF